MLIEDGKGTGSKLAVIDNQADVLTASQIQQATLRGDAYAWNAISSNIDATDVMLYVRNLSQDRLLVINRIYVYSDIATAIDIHLQTIATAFGAAGAAVVGVNLNTSSAKVADGEGYADDDNVVSGTIILTLHSPELTTAQEGIDYQTNDEIILGTNGTIGVDVIAEIVAGYECTIIGYYIDA